MNSSNSASVGVSMRDNGCSALNEGEWLGGKGGGILAGIFSDAAPVVGMFSGLGPSASWLPPPQSAGDGA